MDYRITQCPRCDTSFKVTGAQLSIAGGAVRCGSCLQVFHAPDHWLGGSDDPEPGPAAGDALAPPASIAPESTEIFEPVEHAEPPEPGEPAESPSGGTGDNWPFGDNREPALGDLVLSEAQAEPPAPTPTATPASDAPERLALRSAWAPPTPAANDDSIDEPPSRAEAGGDPVERAAAATEETGSLSIVEHETDAPDFAAMHGSEQLPEPERRDDDGDEAGKAENIREGHRQDPDGRVQRAVSADEAPDEAPLILSDDDFLIHDDLDLDTTEPEGAEPDGAEPPIPATDPASPDALKADDENAEIVVAPPDGDTGATPEEGEAATDAGTPGTEERLPGEDLFADEPFQIDESDRPTGAGIISSGIAADPDNNAWRRYHSEFLDPAGEPASRRAFLDERPSSEAQAPDEGWADRLLNDEHTATAELRDDHAEPRQAEPSVAPLKPSALPVDLVADEPGPMPPPSRAERASVPPFEAEPIELRHSGTRRRWSQATWAVLLALALLGLAAQYVYFNFDPMARGPLRPWLAELCGVLDCRLPSRHDAAQIQTAGLVVRSHPQLDNALAVDAVLTNTAAFAQPFPLLLLQFTDLDGEPVAGRRFRPEEYLGGEAIGTPLMPVGRPVHIGLELADPGPRAINYTLTVVPYDPTT